MKDLVDRVIAKDRTAEIELYKIANKEITPALNKYVKCEQTRKDVKQDVLIDIFTKINQYDESKGRFTAWCFKIAYNRSMKAYNKKAYRKEAYIINDDDFGFDYYYSKHIEEHEQIDYNRLKQVKNALVKLKPGQKQAVTLYDIEGLTHPEIADVLGVSVGTSKSQLCRGRQRIKELVNN